MSNPEPYDMVVIGAGAAGLTAAGFAAELGAKVAIIEKEKLGGDCTWVGCVPSKALLKVGKIAHAIRTADHYGITAAEPQIDMVKVRQYVQQTIEEIYQHETPEEVSKRGSEVIYGTATLLDANTVAVNDRQLKAKKIIIATGGRPLVPPVPGLEEVPYKTNRNIFENDRIPSHLLIMGAGPIGAEMAQAHARLGAKVTLMDEALLRNDDPEAAEVLLPILEAEGVNFIPSLVDSVRMEGEEIVAKLKNGEDVHGDMLLVAVGRKANVENLGLESAGVDYASSGIKVDKFLRTSQSHIYAVGDCIEGPKFTHLSGYQGSAAARNAIFPVVNVPGHDDVLPWVTFTDPEVAHVGLTEAQAREKFGASVKVYHYSMSRSDRGITENDTEGFIKIVYRGSGKVLGVTIVAERAGEMITEFVMLMKHKMRLTDIIAAIHPYPTYTDTIRVAVGYLVVQELFQGLTGRLINVASRVLFR